MESSAKTRTAEQLSGGWEKAFTRASASAIPVSSVPGMNWEWLENETRGQKNGPSSISAIATVSSMSSGTYSTSLVMRP
eukprot:scaffold1712_cov261-Pinguiococcus_pyrenoidosus.AAC.11